MYRKPAILERLYLSNNTKHQMHNLKVGTKVVLWGGSTPLTSTMSIPALYRIG